MASEASEETTIAISTMGLIKNYDLTSKLIPHLDRHLIFHLLEFLDGHEYFSHEEMLQSKFDLLKSTNMTDFVGTLYKEIHNTEDVPAEFGVKREKVLETLKSLEERSRKVLDLFDDADVVSNLRSDKMQNMKYLEENHGVRSF
jgi:translation initiation factor 3 subunit E